MCATRARCLPWTLAVILAGGPAAGQDAPGRDPGLRLGPVNLRPAFELSQAGTDTNILGESGIGFPDAVATAGARVDAAMRVRPFRIDSSNHVAYDYFAHYADQRSVNQRHSLRAALQLSRVTLFTSGTMLDARERINYDMDSRVRRSETSLSIGSELRLTARTSIAGGLRRGDTHFGGDAFIHGIPARSVMQHRVESASASLRYQVTRLTAFLAGWEVEQARFAQAPLRNSRNVRVTPAIELAPGAAVSGSASIGYQSFEPLNSRFPGFSGVVGNADMILPLPGDTRLRFGATRDLEYSYQPSEPLYVLSMVRGSLVRRVADRWELEAGTARQRLAYRSFSEHDETRPQRVSRVDRRVLYHTSISYQASPFLRVGIQSDYARRRSPLRTRQYEELQVGGFLKYEFSR